MKSKYILTTLFCLLAAASHATTISTTLLMTSPSALISMTGVSSTLNVRQISATNISATTIGSQATSISGTGLALAKAWGTFTGGGSLTTALGISAVSRASAGLYDVSMTTTYTSNTSYVVTANMMDNVTAGFTARSCIVESATNTTTTFRLKCQAGTSTAFDPSLVYVEVNGR